MPSGVQIVSRELSIVLRDLNVSTLEQLELCVRRLLKTEFSPARPPSNRPPNAQARSDHPSRRPGVGAKTARLKASGRSKGQIPDDQPRRR
jgi:hypothetical protein